VSLLFPPPLLLAKNRALPRASPDEGPIDEPASLHLTNTGSQKKTHRH
jgi:hypothetical protein